MLGLELAELRFKNIGRFVEEQVIVFSSLGSFVQVDGKNNNTTGSSGSGKTTVFNALDYLLGLNNTPATVLQSRFTKESIWVQGKFFHYGEAIIITRSKGLIQFSTENVVLEKNKAEDKIDEILGMPRDLFRKVIHKRQKEGGFFLDFTPKEMHDFLMDCIGLSPFKEKYSIVEAKLAQLESYVGIEQQTLDKTKAGLSAAQDAILALGLAPIQDMHREVILELKEKFDRSTAGFLEVRSRHATLVQEYVRNRPDTTNGKHDETVREDLERRRKEVEAKISSSLESERQRQEGVKATIAEKTLERSRIVARIDKGARAKADAAKIALEIKSIREATCPTCTQEWKTESAVATEQAKLAELSGLKDAILDGAKAMIEKATLDLDVSALKSALSPLISPQLPILNEELRDIIAKILEEKRKAQETYDQQNAETKAKLDAFVAGQAELQKKLDIDMDQARGQMDLDEKVFLVAANKLAAYNTAKTRYDETFSKLKRNEEVFTKQMVSCTSNLEDATKEQLKALETKKAIKMYVSISFDKALDAIGDKATKIIRCIPNTKNATIQFEGTKETQDGKINEQVNAVISVDGEIGIPIKSLSGGERSAVDLAVDLAVIDYIETKTGKGLNLFILDEPFTGLGTVEIEMALEVLKNSQTNKKLVIVDHNPEVKQMVQNRLVVTRDGLTSKVA